MSKKKQRSQDKWDRGDKKAAYTPMKFKPRTERQAEAIEHFRKHQLNFAEGPPGVSKCVAGNTLIRTENGLEYIEDFFNEEMQEDTYKEFVTGIPTYKGLLKSSHKYFGGVKPTKIITLSNGVKIETSFVHPLMTINKDGQYEWKKAEEITEDDFLAVDRKSFCFPKQLRLNDGNLGFKFPEFMTDDFAYWLGIVCGDGGLSTRGRISFTSVDEALVSEFERISMDLFGLKMFQSKVDPITYSIYSTKLYDQLKNYEITCLSTDKKIPKQILKSPESSVKNFIKGLMDTDGFSSTRNGYVGIGLSNESMISVLQHLLFCFGISSVRSVAKTSHRDSFRLHITGSSARLYYDKIGFKLERKMCNAEKLPDVNNENLDVIYNIGGLITSAKREQKHTRAHHKDFYGYERGKGISYKKLKKIISVLKPSQFRDRLNSIVDDDFLWVRVKSIVDSENFVYDLTVPGEHMFVGNSIVNHNTFLACVHAMELFQKGVISKIVLIRPAVEAGKSLGYLPGTQEEKMYPYLLPIYDNLSKIVDNYVLEAMFENEQIEVLSPTLARGRTLDNSYMIVDEAQNLSKDHLRMILTRIGEGTWCFVSMDGGQIDIQKQNSCFSDMHLFRDRDDIGHFLFTKDDVVRSKLAQIVVNIYEEQLDNSGEL